MDKKLPKGVKIFAILILTNSVLSLLSLGGSRNAGIPFTFFFYLLILPASIAVSIYLLKLKEWARVAIIVISVLVALQTIVTFPATLSYTRNAYMQSLNAEFTKAAAIASSQNAKLPPAERGIVPSALPPAEEKAARQMLDLALIFFMGLSVMFNAGVVYYFVNANVKKSFA